MIGIDKFRSARLLLRSAFDADRMADHWERHSTDFAKKQEADLRLAAASCREQAQAIFDELSGAQQRGPS